VENKRKKRKKKELENKLNNSTYSFGVVNINNN